jgi:predicted permease
MRGLFVDLRLVFRRFRKSPGFAISAILMLAFSIGATSAVFSIVDGVLLRPLPFPDADRLVTLGDQVSGTDWGKQDQGPVTCPEVISYARDTRSFSSLGGYGFQTYELSGIGEPAEVNAARMTTGVFVALGISPMMGRVFTSQEDTQKSTVAVLSYATWKSRFHGDPQILGKKILLNRSPYVVIGVMPKGFEFPLMPGHLNRSEMWLPMSFSAQELSPQAGASWYLQMVGRLKPGVSVMRAQSDVEGVAQQIMRNFPPELASFHFSPVVYPLRQITVIQTRPLLTILFLAVAVVLLIACANLAGLLLVRAIRGHRESALRLALGAPTFTLLREIMLESLVLSVSGGLIGIGLAALGLLIGKRFLPESMPRIDDIVLNWTVVGFAFLVALLTGLLCGLAPGFAVLRTNVNKSLKEGGYSGSAGSHGRLRSILVISEIAIAMILLTASGLLLRSFEKMSIVDLGFRPENVTTAVYSLPQKQYATQTQTDEFDNELLRRLRRLPGAEAVGLTSTLPTTGAGIQSFIVEGYNNPNGPGIAAASASAVIGDYFRAIGISLLRGRFFTDSDTADNQLVVIVNHEFAEHYWPHQDPLGKRMRTGTQQVETPWMTVVGEVTDAKLSSPDADAAEQFYQPVAQLEKDAGVQASPSDVNGNAGYIVLRSKLPARQMENALRASVLSIDHQLPLSQVQSMDQVVSQSEAPRKFNTVIISSFAFAAVLLAIFGVYSVIAYSVAARGQEMAIRVALGSPSSAIVRLVLKSGIKLAVIGCVFGLAGSLSASVLLRSLLFDVSPFDPIVMILTTVLIFLLVLVASALPARRAASANPIKALRGE